MTRKLQCRRRELTTRKKPGKVVTSPALLFSEKADEAPTPQSSLPAIDIVIPQTTPLTEAEWDKLDDVVNRIDGGWGKVEKEAAEGTESRKILIGERITPGSLASALD